VNHRMVTAPRLHPPGPAGQPVEASWSPDLLGGSGLRAQQPEVGGPAGGAGSVAGDHWSRYVILCSPVSSLRRPLRDSYFVVTSATVGYGAFSPGLHRWTPRRGLRHRRRHRDLTLRVLQLATALQTVRGKRLRGVVALDLREHVVVRGYAPGRSEQVVAELTAEGRCEVAPCAWGDVAQ
jgi:voltage-gated potassium channel